MHVEAEGEMAAIGVDHFLELCSEDSLGMKSFVRQAYSEQSLSSMSSVLLKPKRLHIPDSLTQIPGVI